MVKSRRSPRLYGGGLGNTYGFTGPTLGAGIVNNPIETTSAHSTAMAAVRPGMMSGPPSGAGGLPGMRGGKRRKGSRKGRKGSRKGRKGSRRVQSGGRYGMGEPDVTVGGTPWSGGLAPTASIPCEASRSTMMPGGATGSLNAVGSSLWDGPVPPRGQIGGAAAPADITQAFNPLAYNAPTAGYTQLSGNMQQNAIATSAGTLAMINTPLDARSMNPDCLKTGGARRGSRKSRKGSRKGRKGSRKGRKGSRKGRKGSRKGRKGSRKN
jgi:hypothetical protein